MVDLYKEILIRVLQKEEAEIHFPNLKLSAGEIVETVCYRALKKIKGIIQDDTLTDEQCFTQIEEIVCVLEKIGSDGGSRHNFG